MRITSLLLITLLSVAACTSKSHKKALYFPSVGWSVVVPDSLLVEDSTADNPSAAKGLLSIYDTSVWKIQATNLRASIEPVKQNNPEELAKHIQNIKDEFINVVADPGLNASIDTAFSTEQVGGLTFEKQIYTLKYSEITQTVIMYSAIINNYFFDVSISYMDQKKLDLFLDMWRNSTFKQ